MTDTNKIAKLDKDNWQQFNIQFRAKLTLKGQVTALDQHGHADSDQVKALLALHVCDQHLLLVDSADDSKSAYDALKKLYVSDTQARKLQLRREVMNLSKRPDENIATYFNRAKQLESRLVAAGLDVQDFPLTFLSGLPESYEMLITVLTVGSDKLDIDDLYPKLLQTEQLIESRNSKPPKDAAYHTNHYPYQVLCEGLS